MNIIVQKYGGSSLENIDKIKIIANKIIKEKENNTDLVVVVSAQGKTTDTLIEKAKEYSNYDNLNLSKRDLDFLLSTGEMQSASLLSIFLNSKGYKSTCITGFQAGILTDSNFGSAKILDIENKNIMGLLNENYIVIVTGFQGMDKFGNFTTLGRGGSDLSAVALASSLGATKCEIYSDVDGIYTADPRIIENAKLINVNFAKEFNLPILSKSSFSDSSGSEVNNIVNEKSNVHFITKMDDIVKISIIGSMMLSNTKAISTIYSIASLNNIPIYMISFSELSINIIVDRELSSTFMKLLHEELIEKNTID